MGTLKINKLKKSYEEVCNEYVKKFCNKQELKFEGWIAGKVGDVALCGDFFFNFQDIVWDINSKQPKEMIFNWYYQNLEDSEKAIDYVNFTKVNQ